MRSGHCFEESIDELRKHSVKHGTAMPFSEKDTITWLPRGGCIVKTKIGYIQIGMPPETIKDTILLGTEVPQYYVLASRRFDVNARLNTNEFEFPAYFNLFIKKKKACFIATTEGEQAVRQVFRETLLGPENYDGFEDEFDSSYDKELIPDIKKETGYFAGKLTIDILVDFAIFNDKNIVELKDGVVIRRGDEMFHITEDGKEIAIIPDKVEVHQHEVLKDYKSLKTLNNKDLFSISNVDVEHIKQGYYVENFNPVSFKVPTFGITILGASHGFDPHGNTSGLIFWVNGRGIALDPPPYSLEKLRAIGVPSNLIDYIIISHCHGDHDAGALQIILDHNKIEVLTTRTIMGSFLRKYTAITGMSVDSLKKLFLFRPIKIGAPLFLNGATFKFDYSLHSIPALCFSIKFNDKSVFFSGDTLYDPARLDDLVKLGVLSQKRRDAMVIRRFDHDIVLHEAGVPPIHTPISAFKDLPPEKKERIYLYHVAQKDIPADAGVKSAKAGVENTIVLDVKESELLSIYKKLDIISNIDIFQNLPVRNVRDLLESSKIEKIKSGEIFIKEGETGEKFYIIAEGIVRVYSEKLGFERYYEAGDYFGEACLKKGNKRTANVQAMNDLLLYSIHRDDFLFIFGEDSGSYDSITDRFIRLNQKRQSSKLISTISKNSLLNDLSRPQKVQFELIATEKKVEEGEVLWKIGDKPTFGFLIQKGEFELVSEKAPDEEEDFSAGAFVGDFPAMIKGTNCTCTVKAVSKGIIYSIRQKDILHLLEENPKLLVIFSTLQYFE